MVDKPLTELVQRVDQVVFRWSALFKRKLYWVLIPVLVA